MINRNQGDMQAVRLINGVRLMSLSELKKQTLQPFPEWIVAAARSIFTNADASGLVQRGCFGLVLLSTEFGIDIEQSRRLARNHLLLHHYLHTSAAS